ncbi:MAG: hypothetical protein AAF725_12915 [Acidobacteriota bacterium]
MKKIFGLCFVALTLVGVLGSSAFAEDDKQQVLTGEYVWNQGPTGDLKATFKKTGDNTWDVQFDFDFRKKARRYTGTATGDLKTGTLAGTVNNEDKRRTFKFEGSFDENGSFDGTHEETTPGRARQTGTLSLSR